MPLTENIQNRLSIENNKPALPVTVIVLTFNEEKNIGDCLESIQHITDEIFVVDSGSTDSTLSIARKYPVQIVENTFENYSQQRNWALDNLPISHEWVMHLDADHRMTEELFNNLRNWFAQIIPEDLNGFLISRRTIFMGKWIRFGGHYPVYHAILFRKNKGRCEEKVYDQHFIVEGRVQKIKGDIINVFDDPLERFTERHNRWSSLEAVELSSGGPAETVHLVSADMTGNSIQKRRYLKSVYERFPLFVRPFVYFIIRYFFRLGFLDGRRGLIFHFLQGFWFRFLIDAKIYELQHNQSKKQ